jgi:ribosomal protein L7/L12
MMSNDDTTALARRIRLLEKKINMIMEHLGLEVDDDSAGESIDPGVLEAIKHGNKIEAIRIYRELSGFGLKEAKDVIDELEARYRQGML